MTKKLATQAAGASSARLRHKGECCENVLSMKAEYAGIRQKPGALNPDIQVGTARRLRYLIYRSTLSGILTPSTLDIISYCSSKGIKPGRDSCVMKNITCSGTPHEVSRDQHLVSRKTKPHFSRLAFSMASKQKARSKEASHSTNNYS